MRIIRHADCRPMPWKNGGGVTTEIMAWPPEAGLDAFDWRISMAQVASGGPFSVFAGIDRTLTVLEGTMRLAVEGTRDRVLSSETGPYAFPGDVATAAELIEGAVLDFNVMTRRGRFSHSVTRKTFAVPGKLELPAGTGLVFLVSGSGRVGQAGASTLVEAHDAVLVETGPASIEIEPLQPVTLLVVELVGA